jgi:hypothetical protein
MGILQLLIGVKTKQPRETIKIDNSLSCSGILDFIISAPFSLFGMVDNTSTDHVHVDVGDALA